MTETGKSATLKAMELLLYKSRSEKELRDKLSQKGYPEEEIEAAVQYVSRFGYLNDETFAEQYVALRKDRKGKNALRMELREKGIREEIIEEALAGMEEAEEDVVYALLVRRAGEPHELEEKEYRRLFGYCARRGFSAGNIHKALRRYRHNAPESAVFD